MQNDLKRAELLIKYLEVMTKNDFKTLVFLVLLIIALFYLKLYVLAIFITLLLLILIVVDVMFKRDIIMEIEEELQIER